MKLLSLLIILTSCLIFAQRDNNPSEQEIINLMYFKKHDVLRAKLEKQFLNSKNSTTKLIGLVALLKLDLKEDNDSNALEKINEIKTIANNSK